MLCAQHGATREFGKVLVADHTPKVKACALHGTQPPGAPPPTVLSQGAGRRPMRACAAWMLSPVAALHMQRMHHAPFISGLITVQFSPPSVQYTLSDSSGRI